MQNLDALLIFARVAEMTSFTRAAESLGIQKGRVSMVIRQLERDVGVALLHRTTRSVQLTDDGRAFYSRARDLLADVQALQSMFSGNSTRLRGRLRAQTGLWPLKGCCLSMQRSWLLRVLTRLLRWRNSSPRASGGRPMT